MSIGNVRRTLEPHDRATRLVEVAVEALKAAAEYHDDDRVTVALSNPTTADAGIVLNGYDSDIDAAVSLLEHAVAIFAARGVAVQVVSPDGVTLLGDPP